jgi:hypothetical protein
VEASRTPTGSISSDTGNKKKVQYSIPKKSIKIQESGNKQSGSWEGEKAKEESISSQQISKREHNFAHAAHLPLLAGS